jgi:four helix bundle suffix protein
MELKLTNVARASLEELRLDYEDYLRQRDLPHWPPDDPALKRFKALRCATVAELKAWAAAERKRAKETRTDTDSHGRTPDSQRASSTERVSVSERPCTSVPSSAQLVANGALSLLNLCCYFLDQQLATLEKNFLEEGGFTERLYRARTQSRRK